MSSSLRILIVTAPFGEGHNSAARNLGLALDSAGALVAVRDPCSVGTPGVTKWLGKGYRLVTTHFPRLWGKIYRSTDRCDFSQQKGSVMRKVEQVLGAMIEEFQPDAVVSTYPIYPYMLAGIFEKTGKKLPVFTVVTDSIEINSAWLRAPSDFWLVTDSITRDSMIRQGIPAERIVDTGFPVHPFFSEGGSVDSDDSCEPFDILYFPTAKLPHVRRHSRALLEASPKVRLTIVMGRNFRLLYPRAKEIKDAYPGRVRLIAWTRRVPQLLKRHHLVVGKAGGATVHEAIAARCPMFIHHLVPGQEEGNLHLLESIGGGGLANTPPALARKVTDVLTDQAAGWRSMKNALSRHGQNSGALAAASFILNKVSDPKT